MTYTTSFRHWLVTRQSLLDISANRVPPHNDRMGLPGIARSGKLWSKILKYYYVLLWCHCWRENWKGEETGGMLQRPVWGHTNDNVTLFPFPKPKTRLEGCELGLGGFWSASRQTCATEIGRRCWEHKNLPLATAPSKPGWSHSQAMLGPASHFIIFLAFSFLL